MKLTKLVKREMMHRWRSSLLFLLLVAAISGAVTFISVNRPGFEKEVIRNSRDIGSNVVILPIDIDQVEYHMSGGYSSETMPYDVVNQIVEYRASLNHLIPMLERSTMVNNGDRSITARIVGLSASIPVPGRPKSPMQRSIEPGKIQLGSQVANQLGISRDILVPVEINGMAFEISRVNRETGTWQDAAVLMDLARAQQLFEMEGRISRIEAVECTSEECARTGLQPEEVLSSELSRITDRATLLRKERIADARAKIRLLSHNNSELIQNTLWIAMALFAVGLGTWNAIQRTNEIGVLQAIGFGTSKVVALLVFRSMLLTLIGLILGQATGAYLALTQSRELFAETAKKFSIDWATVATIGAAALVLVAVSSVLPAIIFANRNPADVIGKDN